MSDNSGAREVQGTLSETPDDTQITVIEKPSSYIFNVFYSRCRTTRNIHFKTFSAVLPVFDEWCEEAWKWFPEAACS